MPFLVQKAFFYPKNLFIEISLWQPRYSVGFHSPIENLLYYDLFRVSSISIGLHVDVLKKYLVKPVMHKYFLKNLLIAKNPILCLRFFITLFIILYPLIRTAQGILVMKMVILNVRCCKIYSIFSFEISEGLFENLIKHF